MKRTIIIKSSAVKTLKDLTITYCNIEVCAFLFGSRDPANLICKAKKITNIYGSPFEFGITRRAFEHSLKEEPLHFIGIYHSHPSGSIELSQSDVNLIKANPQLIFLVGNYFTKGEFIYKCFSSYSNTVYNINIEEET